VTALNPARWRSICAAAIGCWSRGHTMPMLLCGWSEASRH